jgi:glutathione S-transferase
MNLLKLQYELKLTFPRRDNNAPQYLDIFPLGTVPGLQVVDQETNQTLLAVSEYAAIADYACTIAGERGEEFFPTKDPIARAKIVQMVVHAETTMRNVTVEVWRPLFLATLNNQHACPYGKDHIANFLKKEFEGKIVDMSRAAGWTKAKHDGTPDELVENPASIFLVPEVGNKPTVADFINYAEVAVFEVFGGANSNYEAVYDEMLNRRPAYKRWTKAMKEIPGWEEMHEPMFKYAKDNFFPLLSRAK